MSKISWNQKQIELLDDADIVIVGGGTTGSIAGIVAARANMKVIVIEKYTQLGGTSVHALVSPSMPTFVEKTAILKELEHRLLLKGHPPFPNGYDYELKTATKKRPDETLSQMYFDPTDMADVLEAMSLESGVELYYDMQVIDCLMNEQSISAVIVSSMGNLYALKAKQFIDASGDGVLLKLSGAKYKSGDKNQLNQYTSLRFEVCNVDIQHFISFMNDELHQTFCKSSLPHYTFMVTHQGREEVLLPFFQQALDDNVITVDEYAWLQGFTLPNKPNCITFNCPRIPGKKNILDPKIHSQALIDGHKMIAKYMNFLNKYMPGFEHANLNKIAIQLGIRESIRLIGQYTLTFHDYLDKRKFEDGVVPADWWIDIHKEKHDPSEEYTYNMNEYFEIPFRSMVCDEVHNMVVAGRCISADFEAQASIRIQPQCRMMGEVAAIACTLAIEKNKAVNKIHGREINEVTNYEKI